MEQRTEKFKLEDFGEYLNQGNPDIKEKAYVWAAALGLQATDGLRTSYEMRRTARQYIEGRLTIDEVRQHINEYYKSNPPATTDKEKEQEADKVACNIADVLFNKRLDFSTDGYLNLHRQIFDGVYDHAGQLRATDIVKSEWVLEKDTVFYLHWEELRMALDSNFQFERNQHYDELNKEDLLEWIAFFTAGICGELRNRSVLLVTLPPLAYVIYAGIAYIRGWEFLKGVRYPYFFLNWGSPAGAFGFTRELPFMGCAWWILALLLLLLGVGRVYLVILGGLRRRALERQKNR